MAYAEEQLTKCLKGDLLLDDDADEAFTEDPASSKQNSVHVVFDSYTSRIMVSTYKRFYRDLLLQE
jgi:hypothetical protein